MGRTTIRSCPSRAAALSALFASVFALGGCGGVEFQGKIFDAVGLSEVGGPQPDVRMAERPPLLLPPDTKALPPPGSGVAAATARQDWPKNPEVAQQEVAKAKKDASVKDRPDATPLHPYIGKPTLFNKLLGKKKTEVPEEIPEPDPSDVPQESEAVADAKPQPLNPHVPQEITPAPDELFKPAAPDSYKNPNALY